MASNRAILQCLQMLDLVGYANGPQIDRHAEFARLWSAVFVDVEDEQLKVAVLAWIRKPGRDAAFWPKPGQLLELVPGRRELEVDTADHAWGVLQQMIQLHGSYKPPNVPDPVYGRTWTWPDTVDAEAMDDALMTMGGWKAACLADEDQKMADRHSFRGTYRAMVRRRQIAAEEGSVLAILADARRQLANKETT